MLAYIAAESIHHLLSEHHADTTLIGIVLTAVALLTMPILGRAKHKLATRLGSTATAGEGTQNYLSLTREHFRRTGRGVRRRIGQPLRAAVR